MIKAKLIFSNSFSHLITLLKEMKGPSSMVHFGKLPELGPVKDLLI
jgi:hypothetical protein